VILMARDEDEAPEELTGKEFIDYMNHKKAESEATINKENAPSRAGQNVKTNYVPQNQLDRQALNRKLRDEQKKEQFKKELEEDHPTLVKGVAYTKKILGTAAAKINAAGKRFVEDQDKIDGVKKTPDKKKPKSKKEKDEEEEDDEDMEESSSKKMSSGNKPQLQLGNYKPAYSNDTGIFGSKNYSPAYKSQIGTDTYRPAYKTQTPRKEVATEELMDITKISKKKKSGDITPRAISTPQTATIRAPDRFNTQNWQSLGFPNTLPQNARGSLFTTAPQPAIKSSTHTVPRFASPSAISMSGSMPRIGGMSLINGNLPTIASPALNSAKKSVGELPQLTMMGQPLSGIGKKRKK